MLQICASVIVRYSLSMRAITIVQIWSACDHSHDAYLVGGGIRDMLSGCEPKHFDIITAATPEIIMELFKDCNVIYYSEVSETNKIQVQ